MRAAGRGLLGGIAALASAPLPALAVAAPSSDVDVLRSAEQVLRAQAECDTAYSLPTSTYEEEKARELKRERLLNALSDRVEELAPLPVLTLAGALARARAALAVADRCPTNGEISTDDYMKWLAYAAPEDLVRVGGGEM